MYDLLVVGGGLTGVAAAVSAARRGLKVMLAEQSGFLGGAAGNCLVNPFMKNATTVGEGEEKRPLALSDGMYTEICDELRKFGEEAYKAPFFHEEYLKLILDRMTIAAGVDVLLHVTLTSVKRDGEHIASATFTGKSGLLTFEAKYFVDATGDADFSVLAGCETKLGREADHLCQPMTLCFRVVNVDMEKFIANRPKMTPLYKQFQSEGKIRNPRENVLVFYHPVKNTLHFNTTRVVRLNPVDPFDLTRAEMEAREQMFEMFNFLRDNVAGFENSDLAFSAPQIGVRESRMIVGRHVLTVQEVKDCVKFDDAIAAGNYDIDIHNPEGAGTSHYYFPEGEYYTIPYRSLQPLGTDNLLVAGRCISSDHEAQASYRIMPICICLGQAAGVAASVAAEEAVPVAQADIKKIQAILKSVGAFVGV